MSIYLMAPLVGLAAIPDVTLNNGVTMPLISLGTWQYSPSVAQSTVALGLKVGFTNGCFDLLHPGHVTLMRKARAACDRLVVGLNSDASVKRLKGPDRPVQSEAARAAVLSSLAAVDAVTLFGEDTPLELIRTMYDLIFLAFQTD